MRTGTCTVSSRYEERKIARISSARPTWSAARSKKKLTASNGLSSGARVVRGLPGSASETVSSRCIARLASLNFHARERRKGGGVDLAEEILDVDPVVDRGIRGEPPCRLRQLALEAR